MLVNISSHRVINSSDCYHSACRFPRSSLYGNRQADACLIMYCPGHAAIACWHSPHVVAQCSLRAVLLVHCYQIPDGSGGLYSLHASSYWTSCWSSINIPFDCFWHSPRLLSYYNCFWGIPGNPSGNNSRWGLFIEMSLEKTEWQVSPRMYDKNDGKLLKLLMIMTIIIILFQVEFICHIVIKLLMLLAYFHP